MYVIFKDVQLLSSMLKARDQVPNILAEEVKELHLQKC